MINNRTPTNLDERIIRTLNAKAAQLDNTEPRVVGTDAKPALASGPRRRPRRTVVILVAMLILVAAGATVAVADSRYSIGSGVDGTPSDAQATRLAQEKKDYNPAEIQYLLNQVGGASHTNDQELVGILEFRRACRETLHALSVATSTGPALRAAAVDAIMGPELQRLVDREPSDSQGSQMFRTLADQIKAGDNAAVHRWLEGPRGNCTDAFAWQR